MSKEHLTLDKAHQLDQEDPLKDFRSKFLFPKTEEGQDILYFCGNSLGLQPKNARSFVDEVMQSWSEKAVDGHFYGEHPWVEYHESLSESLSKIVGAKPVEVCVANTLTVNLHLLMVSFYRPTNKRFKILVEADLFPSDLYAVESQIAFHGYDPEEALIKLESDQGSLISREHIQKVIEENGEEIALIMLGGLNYYTGQVFPMEEITRLGHEKGCIVGFDLAHGAGNIPLSLHDWNVDFAVWCNYKYLNSGPGALGGYFIHERYAEDTSLPRFAGWWAQKMESRFNMRKGFDPIPGAEGWVLSNPPILALAGIKASMEIFDSISFSTLRKKSEVLTQYLQDCISESGLDHIEILTPLDPKQRGCQLSLYFQKNGRATFEHLHKNGIITDWREPNVIRIAPAPLYNRFEDVYRVVSMMQEVH